MASDVLVIDPITGRQLVPCSSGYLNRTQSRPFFDALPENVTVLIRNKEEPGSICDSKTCVWNLQAHATIGDGEACTHLVRQLRELSPNCPEKLFKQWASQCEFDNAVLFLETLLSANVDPSFAMASLSREGNAAAVGCLIHAGVCVKKHSESLETYSLQGVPGARALTWASLGGHTDVVELLLNSNAPVDYPDDDGCTALTWASLGGHKDVVERLLTANANINHADEDVGYSPLMCAAIGGHREICRILLSHGAEPNHRCQMGSTSATRAALHGHCDVVDLLLKNITQGAKTKDDAAK